MPVVANSWHDVNCHFEGFDGLRLPRGSAVHLFTVFGSHDQTTRQMPLPRHILSLGSLVFAVELNNVPQSVTCCQHAIQSPNGWIPAGFVAEAGHRALTERNYIRRNYMQKINKTHHLPLQDLSGIFVEPPCPPRSLNDICWTSHRQSGAMRHVHAVRRPHVLRRHRAEAGRPCSRAPSYCTHQTLLAGHVLSLRTLRIAAKLGGRV